MITKIAVYLEEAGSCSMKSMEMEFYGFEKIGSCFRSPYGLCLGTFMHVQVVHEETYSLMKISVLLARYIHDVQVPRSGSV